MLPVLRNTLVAIIRQLLFRKRLEAWHYYPWAIRTLFNDQTGLVVPFYGCHAFCERQSSKGHGLLALATHRHYRFILPLIETPCTTSQLCFGRIKVAILISYLSLYATHKSSCLPHPCRRVSPILQYIILHRAIFVQQVHCIFHCFNVA